MIDADEYKRRVTHNTEVLKDALNKKQNLVSILDQVYTLDMEPNTIHFSLLIPKWADIIPAAFLGHLAIIEEKTGADGIRYCEKSNRFYEAEYKISTFHSSKLQVGPKGGLSIGYGKKPTGVTSYISAAYTIHSGENLETKKRETYLCITDADNKIYNFIDFYKISGQKAYSALISSDRKKRQISLGLFRNHGERPKTVVPVPSWDLYEAEQKMTKHPCLSSRIEWEKKFNIILNRQQRYRGLVYEKLYNS